MSRRHDRSHSGSPNPPWKPDPAHIPRRRQAPDRTPKIRLDTRVSPTRHLPTSAQQTPDGYERRLSPAQARAGPARTASNASRDSGFDVSPLSQNYPDSEDRRWRYSTHSISPISTTAPTVLVSRPNDATRRRPVETSQRNIQAPSPGPSRERSHSAARKRLSGFDLFGYSESDPPDATRQARAREIEQRSLEDGEYEAWIVSQRWQQIKANWTKEQMQAWAAEMWKKWEDPDTRVAWLHAHGQNRR